MRASLKVALPALFVALGCGVRNPDDGSASKVDVDDSAATEHEDGETGVGTFETLWGTAKLDYQWLGGRMIHDGDIVLDPSTEIDVRAEDEPAKDEPSGLGQAEQPLLQGAKKWDMVGGVVKVPYSFAPEVSATRRKQIRDAMDEWEHAIDFLKFVESSTTTGRRVRFVVWDKLYCYVNGSPTDEGKVYTSGHCTWITYVHELGHVLGFRHEQKRNDRETYVHYDKSKTCQPSEFSFSDGNMLGTYDPDSIMHYPSCTFANSNKICGGSGDCNAKTPTLWVLTRRPAYGPAYIPPWEQRSAGNVLHAGDKCNFKSLYGVPCKAEGGGGTGGMGGTAGSGGSTGGTGGTAGSGGSTGGSVGSGSSTGGGAGDSAGSGGSGGSAGSAGSDATGGVTGNSGGAGSGWAGEPGLAGMPSATPAPEEGDPQVNETPGPESSSAPNESACSASPRPAEPVSASWLLGVLALGLLARRPGARSND